MPFLRVSSGLPALALLFALVALLPACDSQPGIECPGAADCIEPPFDPSTVDYDAVSTLGYTDWVRPLLAARDVFGLGANDAAAYAWDRVAADTRDQTVIPYDSSASLLVRLAREALAEGSDDPYPNARRLEPDEVRFLARWIADGARGPQGRPMYADADAVLYVCNQLDGRVAIVDTDRRRTIRLVHFEALGEPANAKPHHVVADPGGAVWYVTLIDGSGGGSVLKLSASLSISPAASGYLLGMERRQGGGATFDKPGMLALDAANNRLYAARSFSASPTSDGLAWFGNTSTMAFEEVATNLPVHPHAVALSPDGSRLYTAGLSSVGGATPVFVFDTNTQDLIQRLDVPGRLAFVQAAVAPSGSPVVLTAQFGDALYVFDTDGITGQLSDPTAVPTGGQPWHPVISPDGQRAYVPNRTSHRVSVVDLISRTVTQQIANAAFSQPHGSAVSRDGRWLYVSSRNLGMTGEVRYQAPVRFAGEAADAQSNVAVIDTQTGTVVAVLPQGRWASGLAVWEAP